MASDDAKEEGLREPAKEGDARHTLDRPHRCSAV